MPLEDFARPPLLVLTAMAAALAVLGLYGFHRRDLDVA
jgi:ABC-2 type transport system permease protein